MENCASLWHSVPLVYSIINFLFHADRSPAQLRGRHTPLVGPILRGPTRLSGAVPVYGLSGYYLAFDTAVVPGLTRASGVHLIPEESLYLKHMIERFIRAALARVSSYWCSGSIVHRDVGCTLSASTSFLSPSSKVQSAARASLVLYPTMRLDPRTLKGRAATGGAYVSLPVRKRLIVSDQESQSQPAEGLDQSCLTPQRPVAPVPSRLHPHACQPCQSMLCPPHPQTFLVTQR